MPSPVVFRGSLFSSLVAGMRLFVPPQPMTCGAEAGRSTLARPGPPSLELLLPEAAKTTIPAAVAAAAVCSIASPAAAPQLASSAPQEIEQTSQPSAVAAATALAMSCDQ